MFRTRTITKTDDTPSNHSLIFAIVTNDINTVKKLVNRYNVDSILDQETGFTSLQYAIASPNVSNEIIKYLLQLGSDPKKLIGKQNIDSFDLAIRYNKKYLFEYFNNIQSEKIDDLNHEVIKLTDKIDDLKETNAYLTSSITNYNAKIDKLSSEIKEKDLQISTLKRKNDESALAFNNLLKKIKK
jgi:outer membrane murein-binding lipoprotein Lpp